MPYYDKEGKYQGPHGMKKKGRKMARKRYGGESHMDRGLSYANAPQGYFSAAGKPMGSYGKPRAGHINQSGMPNASSMKRAMDYMSTYYGGMMGAGGNAGNPGGGYSSTNAGTSPNPGSMDPTYRKGQATIGKPKPKGRKRYR
jgi:hypothetical protein